MSAATVTANDTAPEVDPFASDTAGVIEPDPEALILMPTMAPVFAIDCEERANWLLRKIGNIDAEKARVQAQFDAIMAGLNGQREGLLARHGADLEAWARSEIARRKDGKKSVKLLQGTISFRTVAGSLRLADKEAAFVHARTELPECIITREELDAAAYRKRAQETGEILPGIEAVPGRESMSLKFAAAGSSSAAGSDGGDEE